MSVGGQGGERKRKTTSERIPSVSFSTSMQNLHRLMSFWTWTLLFWLNIKALSWFAIRPMTTKHSKLTLLIAEMFLIGIHWRYECHMANCQHCVVWARWARTNYMDDKRKERTKLGTGIVGKYAAHNGNTITIWWFCDRYILQDSHIKKCLCLPL